jgi:hypothetical protein
MALNAIVSTYVKNKNFFIPMI